MKGILVDPIDRLARAQAGLTWGEFDRETQVYGLATTGGAISTDGDRRAHARRWHRLVAAEARPPCDNLVSADVVTADGRLLTASEYDNPSTSSGACGAAAATSASSRRSSTASIRSERSWPGRSSTRSAPRERSSRSTATSPRRAPDDLFCEFGVGPTAGRAAGPSSSSSSTTARRPRQRRLLAPARAFGSPLEDMLASLTYCEGPAGVRRGLPLRAAQLLEVEQHRELSDDAIDTMVSVHGECAVWRARW